MSKHGHRQLRNPHRQSHHKEDFFSNLKIENKYMEIIQSMEHEIISTNLEHFSMILKLDKRLLHSIFHQLKIILSVLRSKIRL